MDDRRIKKTKKALKNALASLMLKKDLHQITVKELTDTADIHRATFYSHYHDVFDCYEQIENEVVAELTPILSEDNISSYEEWYKKLVTYIYENKIISKMFFKSSHKTEFSSRVSTIIKDSCFRYYDSLQCNDISSVNLDYFINYHVQGCTSMIELWVNSDFQLSIEKIVQLLLKVDSNMDYLISGIK